MLLDEIVPSLDVPGAEGFAREVLGRFANPYLQHQLWDITLQGTTKFRVRVIPSILDHVRSTGSVPRALALGFAGFLAFQQGTLQDARRRANDSVPPTRPASRSRPAGATRVETPRPSPRSFGRSAPIPSCGAADLAAIPGFVDVVTDDLTTILERGPVAAIEALGLTQVR